MDQNNVLFIIADDLGLNLGCYGNGSIHTPHLDKLASSGVRFDHAFASTASCSGSRSVMYTGLHTHTNGQYGLQHSFHHFMTHSHVQTLPEIFNKAGFLTGIIGKVHVGPDSVYPWTIRDESSTRDVRWVADRAGSFFSKAIEVQKPFHLTIGYMDPHRDNTRGGFANKEGPYPDVKDQIYLPEKVEVPSYLTDLPEVRKELSEYYKAISRMDTGVGMVLEELEKAGLSESTLVVFVSDNGAPFLNSKTTLFDAGIRLPLIIRSPRQIHTENFVQSAMVSFVDLLPTFIDWAKIVPTYSSKSTPTRCGRSILPLLTSTRIDWPEEVYGSHTFHEITNYYPTRILRTKRFKYHRNICWKLDFPFAADLFASHSWQAIRNAYDQKNIKIGSRSLSSYIRRGPEELYDLEADPLEVNNLAKNPEYTGVLLKLRNKLEEWQRTSQDPWLLRDGVSVVSMAQYIGQDGGWNLQDRFDFELDNPGEHNMGR